MNKTQFTATVIITTLLVAALAMVTVGAMTPATAVAHGSGGWSGGRGFHGHGRFGRGDPCERMGSHHIKIAEILVEEHLDLTDVQADALQPMLSVVDNWRVDVQETCENAVAATDVPEGLEALEAILSRTATAVGELRPAYEQFYASLDDEQRGHIDSVIARHHERHQAN